MGNEFSIEKRLQALNKQFHGRFRSCMVVTNRLLMQYQAIFPDYTDHSLIHALTIMEHCNTLIGDQIERMTADDLYVLLMGILFHDVGMGISGKDYAEFCRERNVACLDDSQEGLRTAIRDQHHELSGWFLQRHWHLFDIPNGAYAEAIIQVCRGHRCTDLFDPQQYPVAFPVEEGRCVDLLYLAALVRLADELDIAADRNSARLYMVNQAQTENARTIYLQHRSIRQLEVLPDCVLLVAESDDPKIRDSLIGIVSKLADVLKECHLATKERSRFRIRQSIVLLELNGQEFRF